MTKNKGYLKLLRILGIVLFIYILSKIDFSGLLSTFKEINFFYYLMGVLFLAPIFLIRTLKWKILINSVGVSSSFKVVLTIMAKAIFLGTVTPGKLGEFWRAMELSNTCQVAGGKAFYTAFLDRFADLLVVGVIAIFGLAFIYSKFKIGAGWGIYFLFFISLIFFGLLCLKKIGLGRILKIFAKFFVPTPLKEKTNAFLNEFDGQTLSLNLGLFLKLTGYGFLYYFTCTISYYFIALSLGILIPFWYLFFILAMIWLILALPITFLGLGTREAGFIYFFSIIGIASFDAVAFSLLALFYNVLLALPGAILFLKRGAL